MASGRLRWVSQYPHSRDTACHVTVRPSHVTAPLGGCHVTTFLSGDSIARLLLGSHAFLDVELDEIYLLFRKLRVCAELRLQLAGQYRDGKIRWGDA